MSVSRRQLIRLTGGALALSASGAWLLTAGAREGRVLVIVGAEGGLRRVDPRSGEVAPWDGPAPAMPAPDDPAPSATVPESVATVVTEGAVGYWMASPGGDAWIFRLDTGPSSSWWWRRDGGRAVALGLPGDLEPAFASGAEARWLHGATVDAAHLGSGTLRLLAVAVETGEIVLDHALDRRLELAATRVSDDGAVVAHVQGANTGVTFWAADLRGGTRLFQASVAEEPGVAAASAIDLAVAADGDAVLAAAGIARDGPGAPPAVVHVLRAGSPDAVTMVSVTGTLIGIVRR